MKEKIYRSQRAEEGPPRQLVFTANTHCACARSFCPFALEESQMRCILWCLRHSAALLVLISILGITPHRCFAQIAPPNTILRVDGELGSPANSIPPPTGQTWGSDAFLHLHDAISLANDPETAKPVAIWVRGGNNMPWYRPDQGRNVPANRCATPYLN